MSSPGHVLVTGATGYVGRRLVPRLLACGYRVRVLVRDPRRVQDMPWARHVEAVRGDLQDPLTLRAAMVGIQTAYYLVHSLSVGSRFAEVDRRAAENFAEAAADIDHVIYLGGLQPRDGPPSTHLASRAEVGRILARHGRVTEFRAGPIIGSGSRSFEMVRYLTERLPLMVVPRCFLNEAQPVAIRDVLAYLLQAAGREPLGVVEVGGGDCPTFRDMLRTYARVRGLRRLIVALPLPFVPGMAARWVSFVTPVPYSLAAPLLKGLEHRIVADGRRARQEFPRIQPITYQRAVELALRRIQRGLLESHWSGALGAGPVHELTDWEGLNLDVRTVHVQAAPPAVYQVFSSLGGDRGWLVWRWAWRARGWLDWSLGGPGLRRGRRHPTELQVGEALDFWRVEAVQPGHLLRLRAEMRMPGRAWLQWEVRPEGSGSRLGQTAGFDPRGLAGALYWYMLYPIHGRIFAALARALARRAEIAVTSPVVGRPAAASFDAVALPAESLSRGDEEQTHEQRH